MLAFKVPRPSVQRRILNHPIFQISVVLLIAILIGWSLLEKNRDELSERVAYLKTGGTHVSRSVTSHTSESPQPVLLSDVSEPTPSPKPTPAPAAAAAAVAPVVKKTLTPAAKIPTTITMRVFFTEVSAQALTQLFDGSRATGQFNSFGDYVAGIIPDIDQRLSPSNRDIKILAREERTIDAQHPVQIFRGIRRNTEMEVGFTTYVELTDSDDANVRGNLEIIRSWRESPPAGGPPTLQRNNYPAVFELGRGSGFFLSGLMPRSIIDGEAALIGTAPFSILRSGPFRARNSEFVIFIEFDRG